MASLGNEIRTLIQLEVKREWRNRYAFNGMILYAVSTIFVCYLSFNVQRNDLQPITWNVLFWIILLFAAINAVAKSFLQESAGRLLYMYQLASPQAVIIAKIVYNTLLLAVLALLSYGFYALILGNPVQKPWLFLGNLLVAVLGFSGTLTLLSGISAKAGNNSALMAILSLPIMLPVLLMAMKVAKHAMDGLALSTVSNELSTLLAIDGLVIAVSYLLFPYLWRT